MAERDPRQIITPDAFQVAPELLGTPLARPWRRGTAMGIDLVLIGSIAALRISWFLLFLALTFLFLRAALRPSLTVLRKGTRRAIFGSLGVLALIGTLIAGYETFTGFDPLSRFTVTSGSSTAEGVAEQLGVRDAVAMTREAAAVQAAASEAEMAEAATRFARQLRRMGVAPIEIRAALNEMAESKEEPWAENAVATALANLARGPTREVGPGDADSLVRAYAAALQAGDSARLGALHGPLVDAVAAERIASLEARTDDLAAENDELEQELEAERDRGLVSMILNILNEVGIEFGWSALYFTLFPVAWRGRTPGKWLMRIRIQRLDGKPLGWWSALNRFGGYAASIFTGLLGFFEMFWDDNRQALQDRIASTVVVRDTRTRAPAPA